MTIGLLAVGTLLSPANVLAQGMLPGCNCDCNAATGVMILDIPDWCAASKEACVEYCEEAQTGALPFSREESFSCSEQCIPLPSAVFEDYTCKCRVPAPLDVSLCDVLQTVSVPSQSSDATIKSACKQACSDKKVSNGDQPETFTSLEFCEYLKGAPASGPPLNKDCPSGTPDGVICVVNPLGPGGEKIPTVIGRILTALLGVLGSFALLMFVYGGVTWLLSGGNPEKVQKGKNIVTWAVIGMALIFASAALVRFVLQAFTSL